MRTLPLLTLFVGLGLLLPDLAAAQSTSEAKRVHVSRLASVWQEQDARRSARGDARYDARDHDSDSDSDSDFDSDSDSDSDGRRGGVLRSDRRGADCRDVERDLDRAHDEWHRRNDRYEGDRRYEEEHRRVHDRMDRARERAGCDRGVGGTLSDIIFGRDGGARDGGRDRQDRRDRGGRDGGILDRLPVPGEGRDHPDRRSTPLGQLGQVLDDLLGGG